MLDRFSETALNEAKQYYEEQGFRSSWSENTKTMVLSVLNNGLDYGHLMLDMASIVAWVPRMIKLDFLLMHEITNCTIAFVLLTKIWQWKFQCVELLEYLCVLLMMKNCLPK